jgi:hypothetical protein
MALITFTARDVTIYIIIVAARALLQQANDERPLIQLMTAIPKKHITATLTEIDLAFNGIIG